MTGTIRLLFVLILFLALTIPLLPLQIIATKFERFWYKSLPHFWQKCMCRVLGFHVTVNGKLAENRPLMLVSNHVSWSDILVLGAQCELSFISKNEVKNWPMFGTFAKLQRTIFIDRDKKHKAGDQSRVIGSRLKSGDVLVLFAEGTTSDGNRILPIKSSLFGAAKFALVGDNPSDRVYIQPVSIAYTRRHGMPLGRYHRPVAAWPGNVGIVAHLKGIIAAGSIGVEVTFGDPLIYELHTDRKQLAALVEADIRRMNEASRHPNAKRAAPTEVSSHND
jgi:lyso-ornithine lipid O-acyltransferase